MPGRDHRGPNDGKGRAAGVASVVILLQETRELGAIEPAPACVQAAQEFELAACEYRHGSAKNVGVGHDARANAKTNPLHSLHSDELPVAVGAEVNAGLQALRSRGPAHPESVRLRVGMAHA
jgi:hypothetical protein